MIAYSLLMLLFPVSGFFASKSNTIFTILIEICSTYDIPESTATMYSGFASVIIVNLIICAFILQHYVGDFVTFCGNFGRADLKATIDEPDIKKEKTS